MFNSEIYLAISGRMTPVEMLHNFGLERSLSATYNDKFLDLLPGTIPPVGSPHLTAMNAPRERLVLLCVCTMIKLHLMYSLNKAESEVCL